MLISGLGELAGGMLQKKIGTQRLLSLLYIAFVAAFFASGFAGNWLSGLLFVLLAYFCVAASEPIVYGSLHHACESRYRATAESVQSLGRRGLTIFLGFAFGISANKFGISSGFLTMAALFSCIGLGYVFVHKK